ncbi:MAG TPA: single-stranded-DNA-specific exonuclease RecJ [Candidatus Paceibacterota bacterium]|nr:single-stranded-DNA-specific exonuclease RecJ [Candidatus Paceibacterota bacterium]
MQTTIPTPEELEKELLKACGISEKEKEAFLHPEYSIGDLFKFKDMKKAVERIYMAVKNKETIGIYADYDCDGIPGAVVLCDFFEKVGVVPVVYIPDRHDEGYGLSARGIESLAQSGVTLMITVDLGITGIAEVADANARGIDVIVTDHHAPIGTDTAEFPAAHAIIHPAKSVYRNAEPCGAAVAFYLVCAFLQTYGAACGVPTGWEKWLLDLVGFATLSDMVPLAGENRMLASYGLSVMRKTRRVGLQSLFLHNKLFASAITEQDLTFTVAPRLNAASRMDTPMLAFNLLRATDFAEAEALVQKLESINSERKTLVARIVKEANKHLEGRNVLPEIVVIGNPDWRPAVLGLVATKLSESYARSFFVWGNGGDDMIKGSCRMIETHHAAYLMQALPEGMLLHAGGHQAAGGFAVAKEQIHFLEEALNGALGAQHNEKESEETAEASVPPLPLPLVCVTERHLRTVRLFAPFGASNPQPEFLFENVTIASTKMFGKNKEHLELTLRDATGSATAFTFFASADMCETCITGATISFIGTLEPGFRGGARIRIQEIL